MVFSGRIFNSTEITKKAWSWDRSAVGEWEKIMDRVRARVCVCVWGGSGGDTSPPVTIYRMCKRMIN